MNSSIFLAVPIIMLAAGGALAVEIPRWQPRDFEFRSDTQHDNPFMVRFEAEVTGPGGVKMLVPGFYDGGNVWKIRFSPTAIGKWSLVTSSTDPNLDGKRVGDITCVEQQNQNIRGGLIIDPDHPRHFSWENGNRFFLMGYECDWLWALDSTKPDLPVINAFLDKLSSYGYNYVIMNVYAHDTLWRKGRTSARDYGPPPIYPWEGTNDQPVFDRLNPAFWQHYDRVIEAMHQRGIVAHVMTKVFNKLVNWPERNSPADDLFYRTLVARYSAYPNVIWDFAKEAHGEGSIEYKIERMRFIRSLDPYNRLLTIHDDAHTYNAGHYNDVLDYRSDQQHEDWHQVILTQRGQNEWPVVCVEFGYECGPKGEDDHTFGVSQLPEEVVRRAWEIYMAGGYGAYYYTYTAWDIIHPEHTPPGYAYFKLLHDFFQTTNYWKLWPNDGLLDRGLCLTDPGKEYVVYQQIPGEYDLTIEGAESSLSMEWFEPLTGRREKGGKLGNGKHRVTTPRGWTGAVVLHLR